MGTGSSSLSLSLPTHTTFCSSPTLSTCNSKSKSLFTPKSTHLKIPTTGIFNPPSISASFSPLKSGSVEFSATHSGGSTSEPISGVQSINPYLLQELVYYALVWGSLHGLVVGDKSVQLSLGSCGLTSLYMLEKTTFKGRGFITHATKAIYKLLLSDYVNVSKFSNEDMLSDEQYILRTMDKIVIATWRWLVRIHSLSKKLITDAGVRSMTGEWG